MREGSYNDSVGLGSCTGQKGIVLCQVSMFVNFKVDHLKKKELAI